MARQWYVWKLGITINCMKCRDTISKGQRAVDIFSSKGEYLGTAHVRCLKARRGGGSMTAELITSHLAWIDWELERIRQEQAILEEIKLQYQQLLQVAANRKPYPYVRRRGDKIAAVLEVLRMAYPEGLHVTEIWERVQAMGITSSAKRPAHSLGFALFSLQRRGGPVEQVGPATWRWAGGKEAEEVGAGD